MFIYVFRRPGGSLWADFKVPHDSELVETVAMSGESTVLPDRVRALQARAKAEEPQVVEATPPKIIRKRDFMGRLRWLLTGN